MNGKKAKALRRVARAMTVGRPEKEYKVKIHGNRQRTISLKEGCTRKFYKGLKLQIQSSTIGAEVNASLAEELFIHKSA